MTNTEFTFSTFSTKSGVALHDYMEPLLANDGFQPDVRVAASMVDKLSQYDQYHLVYALLVSVRAIPERVVPLLPQFLVHSEAAVRATAINLLDSAARDVLTEEVIDHVKRLSRERADFPYLMNVSARLEKRWRSGDA